MGICKSHTYVIDLSYAVVAQLVEHAHGKGEVKSSILFNGSNFINKIRPPTDFVRGGGWLLSSQEYRDDNHNRLEETDGH
jgi:predicted transposase YbfD/YdcC